MANPQKKESNAACDQDGCADAFAAVAIITVIVAAVCFWLKGMA